MIRRIAAVALCSFIALSPVSAETTEVDADAGPAPSTSEVVATLHQELGKLEGSLAGAKGDNRSLVEEEIAKKRDELSESLNSLVEEFKKAPADSEPAAELSKVGRRAIESEVKVVERELRQLRKAIKKLRATTAEKPEEELARQESLGHDEARYNKLLERRLTAAKQLEQLGLDVESAFARLDELLSERADDMRSVYELVITQKKELAKQAEPTTDDDKAARTKSSQALQTREESARSLLEAALTLMEERELDTATHRQFLIEETGEITADVFDKEVALGLLQNWMNKAKDWFTENGPGIAFKAIFFLLIVLLFRLLAGIARRLTRKALSSGRLELSQLLREFFESLSAKLVMLLGILVALSQIGINLGPVLAGLGVAGFVIGFALQSTLSNFASGLMILAYRPYDVGDLIDVAGGLGKVAEMTLVSTTILTVDNQRLVIPNNSVWGDVIRNVTAEQTRRVDLVFGIGYSDDIGKAHAVLGEIVAAHDKVLDDPEPVVKLHTLGESSVDFVVRPWCKTEDYWDVYWDITRSVKERFDAEGISIPFPQRDVHLFQEKAA